MTARARPLSNQARTLKRLGAGESPGAESDVVIVTEKIVRPARL